MNFGSF